MPLDNNDNGPWGSDPGYSADMWAVASVNPGWLGEDIYYWGTGVAGVVLFSTTRATHAHWSSAKADFATEHDIVKVCGKCQTSRTQLFLVHVGWQASGVSECFFGVVKVRGRMGKGWWLWKGRGYLCGEEMKEKCMKDARLPEGWGRGRAQGDESHRQKTGGPQCLGRALFLSGTCGLSDLFSYR